MISTKIKHFESASYEKGFYVPSHNDILAIKDEVQLETCPVDIKDVTC